MLDKNLKRYRTKKGFTKTDLSKKSGLSSRTIEFLENGRLNNPTIKTVTLLSKALEVEVEKLIK